MGHECLLLIVMMVYLVGRRLSAAVGGMPVGRRIKVRSGLSESLLIYFIFSLFKIRFLKTWFVEKSVVLKEEKNAFFISPDRICFFRGSRVLRSLLIIYFKWINFLRFLLSFIPGRVTTERLAGKSSRADSTASAVSANSQFSNFKSFENFPYIFKNQKILISFANKAKQIPKGQKDSRKVQVFTKKIKFLNKFAIFQKPVAGIANVSARPWSSPAHAIGFGGDVVRHIVHHVHHTVITE